jgi:hypothetical protein
MSLSASVALLGTAQRNSFPGTCDTYATIWVSSTVRSRAIAPQAHLKRNEGTYLVTIGCTLRADP